MTHAPLPTEIVTRTTCPYCGVGCGVLVTVSPDGPVSIAGDPDHPANFGRLCAKGAALGDTLGLQDRLLHPIVHGARASWDEALGLVAERLTSTIAAHGQDSVAFYVSGQMLTEDYYVANKLMKGFIGSANIDTNSRLCMASAVAGQKRAFGTDTVPASYTDLEEADLVVLVGSNLAWCHPILFQRLVAARAAKPDMRIVVVDPRRTATAEAADLHLPVAPGSDVGLFNGLLAHLADSGAIDGAFVESHTTGFDGALAAARATGLAGASAATGLPETALNAFYDLVARTPRTVTVFSQGVNQAVDGTDKVNAILNVHIATGRLGKPGATAFSVTGQPNAMGGREVGGLANQLAAHGELDDAEDRARVATFWKAPRLADRPGLKAVDLFRSVAAGKVKALVVMATNPVDSMPDADAVRAALAACPFVVVVDVTAATDTAALAHVLLPAAAWSEKDGTVTNSERRISRQRAFRPAAGEARADWRILAEIGRRMGYPGFDYGSPAEIFREHAALSHALNAGRRDFDLGGLADLSDAGYDALAPVRWPVRPGSGPDSASETDTPFFSDGRAFTPDGRLRLVAVSSPEVRAGREAGLPFVLNTGRMRDQWHTMTRTGLSARLAAHTAEPSCEIHPADAAVLGVRPTGLVTVASAGAQIIVRALVTPRVLPGTVFVPMHWTDQTASRARVDALVAPVTDPISGQPALKGSRVSVQPFPAAWFGFAVSVARPTVAGLDYAAIAAAPGGFRLEFADAGAREPFETLATRFAAGPAAEWAVVADEASGRLRAVAIEKGHVVAALYVGPEPVDVSRAFVVEALGRAAGDGLRDLLAGRPGERGADTGAVVCTCFNVGARTIEGAVRSGRCGSLADVTRELGAGGNCGSCRPEILRIVNAARVSEPAT